MQNDDAYFLLRALHLVNEQALGDVDRCLKLDKAMRQLIRHWRRNTDFRGLNMCNSFESRLDSDWKKRLGTSAWKPEEYRELSRRVSDSPGSLQASRAVEWAYREALDELREEWHRPIPSWLISEYQDGVPPSRWWLWVPGEESRTARIVTANLRANRDAQHFAHVIDRQNWYAFEWNSPWAYWLMTRIRWQSNGASWTNYATSRRVFQASLELHARKAELGHWPETSDGIPGLGTDGRMTIEYLPRGLWGGPAPQMLSTRDSYGKPINLRGDEPCLVWWSHSSKPNLPTDLVNAPTANDRVKLLEECLVIPLDPLPPEAE